MNYICEIIGLPEAYRGSDLERELSGFGITFSNKMGVVVSQQEMGEELFHDANLAELLIGRLLTKGEVGCALAHRNAARRLVESDKKYSMIFEDDIRLVSPPDLELLESELDTTAPRVIVLGADPFVTIPNAREQEKIHIGNFAKVIDLITPPTGTFAYAINRSAAQLLVNQGRKIDTTADWPISMAMSGFRY
jgi:GR25 family glycosyltransferase involved in LPS biosynthesis